MTFSEFVGVDSYGRDLATGEKLSHSEKYGRAIRRLGAAEVWRYVPYDIDVLCDKYRDDPYFNNTPIRTWDWAAGFETYVDRKSKTENIRWLHSGLSQYMVQKGLNIFSPAECVCVLKECARRVVYDHTTPYDHSITT